VVRHARRDAIGIGLELGLLLGAAAEKAGDALHDAWHGAEQRTPERVRLALALLLRGGGNGLCDRILEFLGAGGDRVLEVLHVLHVLEIFEILPVLALDGIILARLE
jgi:hypothetical protein